MENNIYNPNYYTNLSSDNAMIQAALDAACRDGVSVTIPQYNKRTDSMVWIINESIKLGDNTVLYLDNCTLRQGEDVYDNIFVNANLADGTWNTPNGRQKKIHIHGIGRAALENTKHNELTEFTHSKDGLPHIYKNCMILFVNAEDIIIENLNIREQRYWAFNFLYTSDARISNIDFYALHTVPNQDGIDLRVGCSNFVIENITGVTGDDTVALTCLRSIYDEDMARLGMDDSIHNVTIRNVYSNTPCGVVRLLNHNGKKLYNINIENVGDVADDPAFAPLHSDKSQFRVGACVRIGENFYYASRKAAPEDTYNITVRNVTSRARMAVRIACALSCSVVEDVKVYGDGGTAVFFGEGEVRNLVLRDLRYPMNHRPNPLDDNRLENHYNQQPPHDPDPSRELCAIYFKDTAAENLIVSNLFVSDKLTAVFGGKGRVRMKAENICFNASPIEMYSGEVEIR